MIEKRFVCRSSGFYDRYKENQWLWTEYNEIENIMNNLDIKARERGKALSKLQKENEQLEQRLKEVLDELYCKDRILEQNGIDIECCDDSK